MNEELNTALESLASALAHYDNCLFVNREKVRNEVILAAREAAGLWEREHGDCAVE